MKMDTQTILNIILSISTVYLAYRNFMLSNRKDVQRESEEMTEIRVQLKNVMNILNDMQKDIRIYNTEVRTLSEKVVIIEEKIKTAFVRIDELRSFCNGKHEHEHHS